MTEAVSKTIKADRSRWQFSLRTMLLLMVAAAALSALYRVGPQLDVLAVGAAPAILCAYHLIQCRRRQCRPSPLVMAAVLPSLVLVYMVSAGPAIILVGRYPWCMRIVSLFYVPLDWLYRQNIAFHNVLEWYAEFWWDLSI